MEPNNAEKIFQIMQKFQKLSLNAKKGGEMTRSEIMMLRVIKMNTGDAEGVTISALSERLEITKPAVSQMINGLEDKGYVDRISTKSDRRMVFVRVTELGEQSLKAAQQNFLKKLNQVFEKLGAQDTKTLLGLLEKLYTIASERGLSGDKTC